jgi:hypothetical protein
MAIASQIRQNAAVAGFLPIGAILISPAPWRRKLIAAAAIALAGAVCWGFILIILTRIADLHGYFYTVFKYPQLYAGAGGFLNSLPLPHGQHALRTLAIGAFFLLLILPTLRGRHGRFVLCLLVLGVIVVLMPRRPFSHYWISFFPFLALAIGVTLTSAADRWPRGQWAVVAAILAGGLLGAIFQFQNYQNQPLTSSFQQVAATVDQIAPPGSTLLTTGPNTSMNGAAVMYASSLPADNTFFLLFQIEPPFCNFLPRPLSLIIDQYVNQPPGVMAIHKQYFADTQDPTKNTNTLLLLRRLFRTDHYTLTATDGDYLIFLRDSAPSRPDLAK